MSFLEALRAAAVTVQRPRHPWTDRLQTLRGTTGYDGVERITTQAVLDRLAVEAMKVVHPGQDCEGLVARPALELEPRMNTHKNARMTVHGRALLVKRIEDEDWPVAEAARAAGVSERTAYKWLAR